MATHFGEFKLVDRELLHGGDDNDGAPRYNYCCDVPMLISHSDYLCDLCGYTRPYSDVSAREEAVSGALRISSGRNKGKFHNISDYAKCQKKAIENQLHQNNLNSPIAHIPNNVLMAAAAGYNKLQKQSVPYLNESDEVVEKKFVRRGSMKDEALATFVYYECIRANTPRAKKDIAAFMRLAGSGFSRGENLIRALYTNGQVDLPIDKECTPDFIDRYLEALNLEDARYKPFILEVIERSEERKIGMSSNMSSKIVGSLYIVIVQCKLPITVATLEQVADNIKKNTFGKFQMAVMSAVTVFGDIFDKYGIPYKRIVMDIY